MQRHDPRHDPETNRLVGRGSAYVRRASGFVQMPDLTIYSVRTRYTYRCSGPDLPAPQLVTDQDGLRNLPLRLPPLPALALNREIRLLLGDAEIPLQDPLRALHDLARFEALGQLAVLHLQPRQLHLRPDEKPHRRDQLNLGARVLARLAVLDVDHPDQPAATQHGHRQKRLVAVLRQLVEHLEPRILERLAGDRYRLPMLRDPAGDALPHPYRQAVHHVGVRILRRPQHERVVLEHVNETRVALND